MLPLPPDYSERILIRGVNWLGDAVMTTPALLRLREAFPQAHLTLLTQQKLAPLWEGQRVINEVLAIRPHEGLMDVARRLRPGRYALALALPNSHRSALELRLAGIPGRVGLSAPLRSWLFTHPLPPPPNQVRMRKPTAPEARRRYQSSASPASRPPAGAHQIHHYLHLVGALGARSEPTPPHLDIDPKTVESVRSEFQLASHERWFGLNAGAEYGPAKRWPAQRFAEAAAELQRQLRCRWILFGAPADTGIVQGIEASLLRILGPTGRAAAPVNLAGRTTLPELCAALKCCQILLTNDTGPMHVAAALGVPVVVPFGSTAPELTGPGLPGDSRHALLRHPVPCSPCFLRTCPLDLPCLTGIAVSDAVAAARRVCRASDNPS